MKYNDKYCIILCSVPNKRLARNIAKELIISKVAACIKIKDNFESYYIWDNILTKKHELQLIIKSKNSLKKIIFNKILAMHPYKVPELIVLSIQDGYSDYIKWIDESTIDSVK